MMSAKSLPPLRADGLPVLNHYLLYRADPLTFWYESGLMGPLVRIRLGPRLEFWVVTEPSLMQHILQKRARYYPRERRLMRLNRRKGPELLFNTDKWEEWLWRRRLMQPAFHRQEIAGLAERMVAEAEALMAEWQVGQVVDFEHAMKTLTMRIIGRTMFSVDVRDETDMLQDSFEVTSHQAYKRASSMLPTPLWLPTKLNREAETLETARIGLLHRIVHERYESQQPQGDLLDMLIAAHLEEEEGGHRFTAEQLVYEMSGIVFCGS